MISNKNIDKFEKNLNFKFKNKKYLINALVHPSFVVEKKNKKEILTSDFERLEFLGDRVLGLIISSLIYNNFKNMNEGNLTKKLSYLVQKEFLYKIAKEIEIDRFLKYSFRKDNPRMNISILSDSVESLIGSIFLDSGYLSVYKFIKRIWGPYLNNEESNQQDSKTNLQEISQKKYKILPIYTLIKKEGPSHSPMFTVSLDIFNGKIFIASGPSKREAEKNVAKKALEFIND
mgnify:CR=1 FL=1|tara:strand:+ start:3095 stop:3790 length:696 start_codon:yes stop_codon:yes gene_type:complete